MAKKRRRLHEVGKFTQLAHVTCIQYPNRSLPRLFDPKKIGDIVCLVLRQSAEGNPKDVAQFRIELRRQIDRCFPCSDADQQPNRKVAAMAQAAAQALRDSATVIAIALAVLLALFALVRFFPLIIRAVPALAPIVARIGITQLPGIIARLRTQQAANDALWRLIVGLR